MVWNTPPREAHHERRNLGDVVYVPVFWLQDSGRRQFALIRLPFLLWGAFRIQRDLGQGFAMAAYRLGYDICQPSRNRHIRASFSAFPRFDRTEKKGRKAKLMYTVGTRSL
jgi:hypothetical protein